MIPKSLTKYNALWQTDENLLIVQLLVPASADARAED